MLAVFGCCHSSLLSALDFLSSFPTSVRSAGFLTSHGDTFVQLSIRVGVSRVGVCRESVCCGIGVCGCRRKCCGCAGTGVHLVFSEDRPASGNVAARLPPLPPPSVVWVGWRGGRVVFGGCGLLRLKCFRRTPAFFPSCVCLFGAVFVTGPCSSFACNSFFCFFALHKRPCLFLTLFRVPRS